MDGHPRRKASSPSTSGSVTSSAARSAAAPASTRRTIAASTPGSGRPIDPGRMSCAGVLAIMMPPVSVCQ